MSYSTHHSDYFTNDTATAADSHAFLRAFFERYPHLQHNDFYISGEPPVDKHTNRLYKLAAQSFKAQQCVVADLMSLLGAASDGSRQLGPGCVGCWTGINRGVGGLWPPPELWVTPPDMAPSETLSVFTRNGATVATFTIAILVCVCCMQASPMPAYTCPC